MYFSVIPAKAGIHTPRVCGLQREGHVGFVPEIDGPGDMVPRLRGDDMCLFIYNDN